MLVLRLSSSILRRRCLKDMFSGVKRQKGKEINSIARLYLKKMRDDTSANN